MLVFWSIKIIFDRFDGLFGFKVFFHLVHFDGLFHTLNQKLTFFVGQVHQIRCILSHIVLQLDSLF